jgi:D-alanine-D-alanine ligase
MNIAVVWNKDHSGVINRYGQPCTERYGASAIKNVVSALEAEGHIVRLLEGDKSLLARLEDFMPPDINGQPTGMVFNLAYGIQGDSRYTHVPAMLEAAGVPYTGSTPMGHGLALDKAVTKILLQHAGVPTPAFRLMRTGREDLEDLTFPVIVKPVHESTSFGLQLVHDTHTLPDAVRAIVETYRQDALVETYVEGREVCVGLLGNDPVELLPLVEQDFGDRTVRLLTWADKMHNADIEPGKICPAPIDTALGERLRAIASLTFRACHCRDYARVDIRIDENGKPYVLEINSMASLGLGGSYMLAAKTAGYTPASLAVRIVDVAHHRYFGVAAPRGVRPRTTAAVA